MSTSPLRLSLRRKRSTRPGDNSGSPAVKKNSPKLLEVRKEPPSTPKTSTSRHTKKLTHTTVRTSPRLSKGRSTDKSDNEEKNVQTPVSAKWTHASEESMRQPSPDMPFISSQLCGTQECEVVWDCDSPGFSKDDLKRMYSGGEGDGPEGAVVAACVLPRQLFPQTRTRLSRASSSSNTTAQLNDLLDLLSSRENAGRKKKEKEDSLNLVNTLQEIVPPKDSHSEGSSSSESFVATRLLGEASSQPFEVPDVCAHKDSDQTVCPSDHDESVWKDDLNLGMCDISDSVFEENGGTRSSRETVSVSKGETDRSGLPSENAELSSVSADIFDDDLFSESVILSTQAVEEAMTTRSAKNVTNDRNYSGADHSKEIKRESKNVNFRNEENRKNVNSIKDNNMSCKQSELSTHDKLTTNIGLLSKVNINHNNSTLESTPQRKVRRSFRFGASPTNTSKGGSSKVTEKMQHTHTSPRKNQVPVRTKERCELKTTNLAPAIGPEKPNMQNVCVSSVLHIKSKTSSMPCNPTELPTLRKPLFKSSDTKVHEVRSRGNAQGTRGPLLRSQSIGNVRPATSSPVARRSNSSVELDSSQDLEDDDFFKSLLSNLPEEEGGFIGDAMLPLSPIGSECRPQGSHSSDKSLGNSRFPIRNRAAQIKGSNNSDKRDMSHVSNSSMRTLLVSQVKPYPGVTNPKVNPSGRPAASNIQGIRPTAASCSSTKTKPLDTREAKVGGSRDQQTSDTFDDGLFEEDVLSLIDEVESQFGSQNGPSQPSASPQSSQPQIKCTQDEIARKKAAALQRREQKRRQQYK